VSGDFSKQIADNHQSCGDPDTRLELDGHDIEATNRIDYAQSGPDGALGIVLMGSRVAEIDQDSVAYVLGDKPVEPRDDLGGGVVICAGDLAQILGIEARRERR